MTKIRWTVPLARAVAEDAGNRSMRTAGRTSWSLEDWQAAADEFDRLLALIPLPRLGAAASAD